MSEGNGRSSSAADESRWRSQAEAHDDAREQERHLDLVFRELRGMREDMAGMRKQVTESVDRMSSILDGMNAALGRFMAATNDHEKRLASLEDPK